MYHKRNIVILGSTGSIGTQTLAIVRAHPDRFRVIGLSACHNEQLLAEQAAEFSVTNTTTDPSAIEALAVLPEADVVVNAIVGFAGLAPTLAAVRAGKTVALANKESFVVAGEIIMREAKAHNATIVPIDSEHSAIAQCLRGEEPASVRTITLTCSGGPFRGMKRTDLAHVTKEQALSHPTWSMGSKISVDSATLMNKGLEIIEARWLFDIPGNRIEVVVHPESIVHAFVEFHDGSTKAQLGVPSMAIPILYALQYPDRDSSDCTPRLELSKISRLTFEPPDVETFPCLTLARQALETGGTMPAVLNAANEIAVQKFLDGTIQFLEIPAIIESAMSAHHPIRNPVIEDVIQTDAMTRTLLE